MLMSLVSSYASAQASLAPPPNVHYGAPISLESAKKAAGSAIAEAQKQMAYGSSNCRYRRSSCLL